MKMSRDEALMREMEAEINRLRAVNSDLIMGLEVIERLEARADETAGLVDNSHTKALRAACKIARTKLAEHRK